MARKVTVLGLEGATLRGVRLETGGEAPVRDAEADWPLVADAPGADGEGASAPELPPDEAAAAPDEAAAAEPLVQAFEAAAAAFGTREVALSLPLSMLLVTTVRVPASARDTLEETAREALAAISPFPDEPLTPGIEAMIETDEEIVAVAAALPDAAAAEVGEALAAARVHVVRTDATALGWLRALWPRICEKEEDAARRIVLLDVCGGWDFALVEAGAPTYLRGLGEVADAAALGREVMLSLFQAGGGDVEEVVVCARAPAADDVAARLAAFGPVRTVLAEDAFAGVEGSALRAAEGETLDVTPEAWREARAEARFRRGLARWAGAALGAWVLLMGALFGVDAVYDFRTGRVNAARNERRHKSAVRDVVATTNSVALIARYRDHAHGALEVLKTVSDLMPDAAGMHLQSFSYRRGESVRVRGFAEQREDNRDFQDSLKKAAFDDETPLFEDVKSASNERATKKGFPLDLECFFFPKDAADEKGGAR